MKFRTALHLKEIKKSNNLISYKSKIGLIGSCFVENIGTKLEYFKFNNWLNPYGILFNPLAIERALHDIVNQKEYLISDLIFTNEHWHSLQHHSNYSSLESADILNKINSTIKATYLDLQTTSHLIITLGTAWVYHHIKTDEPVANCHKIPQTAFNKRLLSTVEISQSLQNSIDLVRKINPKIEVIISLSPVRHLKDGMLANSQSKARLLNGIYTATEIENTSYFPAYEIMIDELRDYRFYTKDMLHPNETSIDYIWKIFKEVWIDSSSFDIMKDVNQIQSALQHKAFSPNSEEHQAFLKKITSKQTVLKTKYNISF